MTERRKNIIAIPVTNTEWALYSVPDGATAPDAEAKPAATLRAVGQDRWRLTSTGSGQGKEIEGTFEEVIAKVCRAANEIEADAMSTMAQFYLASMSTLNVLACKTATLPAFMLATANVFADTLADDVKPEQRVETIQTFGQAVANRLKHRAIQADMDAKLGELIGELVKSGALGMLPDGDDEATKH